MRAGLPFAAGVVLIWKLLFPLAVFWRRARWPILGFGVLFHISTMLFMNVFFPYQLVMYLIFVDWDRLARWLRNGHNSESDRVQSVDGVLG